MRLCMLAPLGHPEGHLRRPRQAPLLTVRHQIRSSQRISWRACQDSNLGPTA